MTIQKQHSTIDEQNEGIWRPLPLYKYCAPGRHEMVVDVDKDLEKAIKLRLFGKLS